MSKHVGKHRKPPRFNTGEKLAVAAVAVVLTGTVAICVDAVIDSVDSSQSNSEVTPINPITKNDLVVLTPPAIFGDTATTKDAGEYTPPSATLETQSIDRQPDLEIMPAAAFMACKADHHRDCPAAVFNG